MKKSSQQEKHKKKTWINREKILSRNTFWFAPPFMSILTSSQHQSGEKANANLKAKREESLISCFDGYERKTLLILRYEKPGENFFLTLHNRKCFHVCASRNNFTFSTHIFSFPPSSSTSSRALSVSELECRNVKRQSKRRKLNSSNVACRS